MSTTTLKLPPALKRRISSVVRGTGRSAHAFMVDAISAETERAERRRRFIDEALAAGEEMQRTGLGYELAEVRRCFQAKLSGKPAQWPRARRWRR